MTPALYAMLYHMGYRDEEMEAFLSRWLANKLRKE